MGSVWGLATKSLIAQLAEGAIGGFERWGWYFANAVLPAVFIIKSEITETENGANLMARFTFSCQAEAMIFELANR